MDLRSAAMSFRGQLCPELVRASQKAIDESSQRMLRKTRVHFSFRAALILGYRPRALGFRAKALRSEAKGAEKMGDSDPVVELEGQVADFDQEIQKVQDAAELYALRVRFLGKKGSVTVLRSRMGKLPPEERKSFGQAFNRVKNELEAKLDARDLQLKQAARQRDLDRRLDLSAVQEAAIAVGSLHPITRTRLELESIFRRMGFDVADGPHVEHEHFNFDALNIVAGHPARDMQDTFVVRGRDGSPRESGEGLVLRSHTSPVQVRSMLNRKPPLRIVMPGTVFRRDDDATHSPMFHQIEGLYVDKRVTMADLKATLFDFVGALFGSGLKVRLRPSYFPFVEPGAEFDMQCPFCRQADGSNKGCSTCKGSGWIELGGCGMVHPAVFEAADMDPEVYSGWAFGFGIDRMAMLRYDVPDLRLFFEGDLRFLEQFPC